MTDTPIIQRLHFRWSWRPYQQRLLDTIDRHLHDGRLHIVAAPGAGKTTLGLEVFRRLGKPALVLAPTLTIRDQWVRRLHDFVRPRDRETPGFLDPWTSKDLERPALFTVATYQAVLARSRADDDAAAAAAAEIEADLRSGADAPTDAEVISLIETLREAGVGTLILDEAHHLKQAWWRALERVVAGLDDLTLVSLTGTPPYDATGLEWRRYEELCGPIDDEISVPELVKAGTLCPHQDFVYAVAPDPKEAESVRRHDAAVASLLTDLSADPRFQQLVDSHPWLTGPVDLDDVLGRPEVAVALLAYSRATAAELPQVLLGALELTGDELPPMNRRWWQVLLAEVVLSDRIEDGGAYREGLVRRLREDGILWRRSLRIVRSAGVERALSLSRHKITACVEVHRAERRVRGDALRQVVLTDFIRADSLDTGGGAPGRDLGALPVFDALVAAGDERAPGGATDIALVTGSLAALHESRLATLNEALPGARTEPLPGRPGWVRIEGAKSGRLVAAFTRLLGAGELRTMVGTRALLGEGWDAPPVNSLVLASFIGAFVSTNQMRGRAIRTDPADLDKVASVWHLAAVAPDTPTGFMDFESLGERFGTFVGLSVEGGRIESGIGRLSLPRLATASDLDAFNVENVARLGRLDRVATGWKDAIDVSVSGQVVPTVSFRRAPSLRPLQVTRTLRYVLIEAGFASIATAGEIIRSVAVAAGGEGALGIAIIVAAAISMVAFAPRLLRAAKLAFLHAPIDGAVTQIGEALLDTLAATDFVERTEAVRVRTGRAPEGGVFVSLEGGTFYEQSLFADAMGEILGPVENPRYLITRPRTVLFGRAVDYHAVPHVLGAKKALAQAFHAAWLERVGEGELIYTRREGGRRFLLAARGRAFSNQFVDPAERLDRWQ